MATATFRIWRGTIESGEFQDYKTDVTEGMVVLDAAVSYTHLTLPTKA